MRIGCLCVLVGLLLSGCATTSNENQVIDPKVSLQFEQVNSQIEAQKVVAATTLEDMKDFVDRLGRRLDLDVKELQSGSNGLAAKINSLENSSGDAQQSVDSVKADFVQLNGSIGSLSSKVDSLNAGVKEFKTFKTEQLVAQKKAAVEAAAAAKAAELERQKPWYKKLGSK